MVSTRRLTVAVFILALTLFQGLAQAGADTAQGEAHVTKHKLSVTIDPSSRSGTEGEDVTFTVTVTNQGDNADNYDLSVTDTLGWTVSLAENALYQVENGESKTTTLTATLETGTDNITVTVTSQGDPLVSESASCTATGEAAEEGWGGPTVPSKVWKHPLMKPIAKFHGFYLSPWMFFAFPALVAFVKRDRLVFLVAALGFVAAFLILLPMA